MVTNYDDDQFMDPQDKIGVEKLAEKLNILPYELRAIMREVGRNKKDIEQFVKKLKGS